MTDNSNNDPVLKGYDALHSTHANKGTAFTPEEREALALRGLLPHAEFGQNGQMARVLENICLLYTSPSPRDLSTSRMPSSA